MKTFTLNHEPGRRSLSTEVVPNDPSSSFSFEFYLKSLKPTGCSELSLIYRASISRIICISCCCFIIIIISHILNKFWRNLDRSVAREPFFIQWESFISPSITQITFYQACSNWSRRLNRGDTILSLCPADLKNDSGSGGELSARLKRIKRGQDVWMKLFQ